MSEFIIITNPSFDNMIKDVMIQYFPEKNIKYTIQHEQRGISHALLCADEYIDSGDTVLFILGDNFFQNDPTKSINIDEVINKSGAYIFSHKVDNPEEFGVAELDAKNNVVSIEEKPEQSKIQ
jgi:glucose-1-phosphate thymidylyltransferase